MNIVFDDFTLIKKVYLNNFCRSVVVVNGIGMCQFYPNHIEHSTNFSQG